MDSARRRFVQQTAARSAIPCLVPSTPNLDSIPPRACVFVRRTPASAWVQIWVRYGSNWRGRNQHRQSDKRFDYKQLVAVDYSPEKAGVGGSIPSLATISCSHLANQPKTSHL